MTKSLTIDEKKTTLIYLDDEHTPTWKLHEQAFAKLAYPIFLDRRP